MSCLDADHPPKGIAFGDNYRPPQYGGGYHVSSAVQFFIDKQIPFVDSATCAPRRSCDFGSWQAKEGAVPNYDVCIADASRFPRCVTSDRPVCADGSLVPWRPRVRAVTKVDSSGSAKATVENMQRALLKYGPLAVSMQVFDDFSLYAGGVYRHDDKPEGGWRQNHAVVIYGWGEDNGKPFWYVQNSWGTNTGVKVNGDELPTRSDWDRFTDAFGFTWAAPSSEGGFWKVARGENMVAIEDAAYYVEADALDQRDVRVTLGRAVDGAQVVKDDQNPLVSRVDLRGDAALELVFYLPAELLTPASSLPKKRVVDRADLRLYAQSCTAGSDPGSLQVLAYGTSGASQVFTQTCNNASKGPVSLDLGSVIQDVVKKAPSDGPYARVTLRVKALPGTAATLLVARNMVDTLYPGGAPPPPPPNQSPDVTYVPDPAYAWPPQLIATTVLGRGTPTAPTAFPRLHLELREAVDEKDVVTPTRVNLTAGAKARQSSTVYGGDAARAIDGNTDGVWRRGSVTHTDNGPGEWLELDLGAPREIAEIDVYNRTDDCCVTRIYKARVEISSLPCDDQGRTVLFEQALVPPGSPGSLLPVVPAAPVVGRYVCVRQPEGVSEHLSVAEVQVVGRREPSAPPLENLARGALARQSSTLYGGDAARAVDGNIDGAWKNGSVTHSGEGRGEWLEVDLGRAQLVSEVAVFSRTDGCCSDRLFRAVVELSMSRCDAAASAGVSYSETLSGDVQRRYRVAPPAPREVRYVCVRQRPNTATALNVAEVQVLGRRVSRGPVAVALYSGAHGRFLRLSDVLQLEGSSPSGSTLPDGATAERFQLVDGGDGSVALYSPAKKRFVRLGPGGAVDVGGPQSGPTLDPNWPWERFWDIDLGNGERALYSRSQGRFLRLNNQGQVDSSIPSGPTMDPAWKWERFTLVPLR